MATFKVISEPTIKTEIVRDKDKKEIGVKKYVYYGITFDEPFEGKKTHYRKENGLKNYDISLVRGTEDEQRINATLLLKKIKKDLADGIDPKFAKDYRITVEQKKIVEAQKVEAAKVSLDDAIKLLKDAKGYSGNKIAAGKEITAAGYLSIYNNDFRRYVKLIGKESDLRAITKADIRNYIELHFNPSDKYLYTEGKKKGKRIFDNWTAKSCTTAKATISSLFSVLVDKDLIPVNPCFGVKIKRDSEKIIIADSKKDVFELWTKQEMNIFFADTDDMELLYYSTIGKCIYYSAIRKSEIFRVTMDMVDFENECFAIPAKLTKAAKKHSPTDIVHLDMPDALIVALEKWIAVKYPNGYTGKDFLFPHKTKIWLPTDYRTFNSNWDIFREKLRTQYEGLFMKNIYALKHNGLAAYFHLLIKRTDLTSHEVKMKMQVQARHEKFDETENYLRKHNLMFEKKREKANF